VGADKAAPPTVILYRLAIQAGITRQSWTLLMNSRRQSGSVKVMTVKSGLTSAIFLSHSAHAPHGAIGLRWFT
jgi:hypothetical protein